MRLHVPTIPHGITPSISCPPSVVEALEIVTSFLSSRNVAVLTGAGVSVDSGIRAYRGKDGRYLNPNYKPIFYQELSAAGEKGHAYRQRYWLRSLFGYPSVRDAKPNPTHFALATLQYGGYVSKLITQNVDGLHHKALSMAQEPAESILELHGTLHRVRCNRGHVVNRNIFQEWLGNANPQWKLMLDEFESNNTRPRTNPDGDIDLSALGVTYDNFRIPQCPDCLADDVQNTNYKPDLIFFGESIPEHVRDESLQIVENCDRLLLIGTTLATYSAFRLLKRAFALKKPVLLINLGPSRADGLEGVQKLELPCGSIMVPLAKTLLGTANPVIEKMLKSGVVSLPV